MTKKDYLHAVSKIKSETMFRTDDDKKFLIDCFVSFFQDDNSKFDEDRFRKACQDA